MLRGHWLLPVLILASIAGRVDVGELENVRGKKPQDQNNPGKP